MNITRFTLYTVVAILSIVSAILTFQFTYSLDADNAMVFGITGLALDFTKSFILPSIFFMLIRSGDHTLAVFVGGVGLVLIGMSFLASYATIDTASNDARKSSHQYTQTVTQIDRVQRNIEQLHTLAAKQIDYGQVTNAANTNERVSVLEEQVTQLNATLTTINDGGVLAQYGSQIAIFIGLVLELVTIMLITVNDTLNNRVNTVTHSAHTPTDTVKPTLPSGPTVQVVTVDDICSAILAKEVVPSHRSINAKFRTSRDNIQAALSTLAEQGLLKPYRNGYALA